MHPNKTVTKADKHTKLGGGKYEFKRRTPKHLKGSRIILKRLKNATNSVSKKSNCQL